MTRARIYQLMDDAGQVIRVRWPEGRFLLAEYEIRLCSGEADQEAIEQFQAIRQMFFPAAETVEIIETLPTNSQPAPLQDMVGEVADAPLVGSV